MKLLVLFLTIGISATAYLLPVATQQLAQTDQWTKSVPLPVPSPFVPEKISGTVATVDQTTIKPPFPTPAVELESFHPRKIAGIIVQ